MSSHFRTWLIKQRPILVVITASQQSICDVTSSGDKKTTAALHRLQMKTFYNKDRSTSAIQRIQSDGSSHSVV